MKYTIPFAALFYVGCGKKSTDTSDSAEEIPQEIDTAEPIEDIPQDSACNTLSTSECSTCEDYLIISGAPLEYVETDDCYIWGDTQEVGCMSAENDCGTMDSWVSDGTGECMFFPNTCYPESWGLCDILTEYAIFP